MRTKRGLMTLCGCLFALVACGDNEVQVATASAGDPTGPDEPINRDWPENLLFYDANTLAPAWNLYGKADKGHPETRTLDCSEEQALRPQAIALDHPPPPHLLITEISEPTAYNAPLWIEVFNPTDNPIHLDTMQLRSYAIGDLTSPEASDVVLQPTTFDIPAIVVPPRQYVALYSGVERPIQIHGEISNTSTTAAMEKAYPNAKQVVVTQGTGANALSFFWSLTSGFVELVDKSTQKTIDFVRFGTSIQSPISANAWQGDAVVRFNNPKRSSSIARLAPYQDTNQASDWSIAFFSTANHLNLAAPLTAGNLILATSACGTVGNNDDLDLDGIPDCAETACGFHLDLPFYHWGARPDYTDVFVQIDYMDSGGQSHNHANLYAPTKVSLDKVRKVYWEKSGTYKIHVHYDVGDMYTHPDQNKMIVPDLYNLYAEVNSLPIKQGGNNIPYAATSVFAENTGIGALYHAYSTENRYDHFYYQFNVNQFAGEDDQTYGLAVNNTHKLAIAMAGMDNLSASLHTWYQTINQAHELGHCLNLTHGGDENVNFKWNYYSMMNYSYSFRMPNSTDYFANKWQGSCSDGKIRSLFEPSDEVDTMNLYLNYSYGTSSMIDTQSMSERNIKISDEFDSITSDLNNNGQIDDSILCRIAEGFSGSTTYTAYEMNDFNDWAEIKQHVYYNKNDLNISSLTTATRPELTTLPTQEVFVCGKN